MRPVRERPLATAEAASSSYGCDPRLQNRGDDGFGPAWDGSDAYDGDLRIGIHTSRAKSLEDAAVTAHNLGANTFQIFSASPRMWRAGVPDPVDVKKFRDARLRFDLAPLAIH